MTGCAVGAASAVVVAAAQFGKDAAGSTLSSEGRLECRSSSLKLPVVQKSFDWAA